MTNKNKKQKNVNEQETKQVKETKPKVDLSKLSKEELEAYIREQIEEKVKKNMTKMVEREKAAIEKKAVKAIERVEHYSDRIKTPNRRSWFSIAKEDLKQMDMDAVGPIRLRYVDYKGEQAIVLTKGSQ